MRIIKSINSVIFQEGIINFIKRKQNKTFLDNRLLYTINYNGKKTKIFLNKKFGFVDNYIFENGIYEKEIIDDIRSELSSEKTFLDIGSNIGQHSLLLAPYCKQIFAYEPIPLIYTEFLNSIKANGYKNIVLQNTAIGAREENRKIYFHIGNSGASSFLKNRENNPEILVKINTLASTLPKNQEFHVVKIDVEGFEAVVILGNKEIFLKNRPTIFLEFSPNCIRREGTYSPEVLLNFFLNNHYEIFSRVLNKTFTEDDQELYQTDNLILRPKAI